MIYIRDTEISVNIGRMYLDVRYTSTNSPANAKNIWFTKKNGISCGMLFMGR